MKKLIEKMLDFVIRWILRHRRIRPDQRCPGCGAREGNKIKYDPGTKRVLCFCATCTAVWPRMPVVPSHAWDLMGKIMDAAQKDESDIAALFAGTKKPVEEKK